MAGYDNAAARCTEYDSDYHLLADFDPHAQSYLTSRLDAAAAAAGTGGSGGTSLMAWVGAQRETNFGQERWAWVTGERVGDIEWGRGQPNNYNQEQNCAVLDSELDWKWNDISCKISAAVVCQGKPSRCPSPRVPEGVYYTGSRDVGSQIQFHCPEGHMPEGEGTESECLESGEWSSLEPITCKHVDCGQGGKSAEF